MPRARAMLRVRKPSFSAMRISARCTVASMFSLSPGPLGMGRFGVGLMACTTGPIAGITTGTDAEG